jgi:hypothetical protein
MFDETGILAMGGTWYHAFEDEEKQDSRQSSWVSDDRSQEDRTSTTSADYYLQS